MRKEEMRPHTVCFTGHRDLKHPDIPARLDALLTQLVMQGFWYYGAGGAIGFDTLAAEAVLRVREKHPVKLILVLPFPEQAKSWSMEQQEQYERIKQAADKVVYTSDSYTRGCFHVRNRALVDGAGLCVSYLLKNEGGTYYTCGYAREQGIRVINIAEGM